MVCLSNRTLHPSSQSVPIDRRFSVDNSSKICASFAFWFNDGILRFVLCVDVIICPFETWTVSFAFGYVLGRVVFILSCFR